MQSAIAICNVALSSYLGTKTITSFQEASPEAQQCALHYDRVRRSLLQRWPWLFASTRETLVAMTLNDRRAWAFRYARPAQIISVSWINEPDLARGAMELGVSPDTPREMTSQSIYSDVPDAVIEFTRDETDPTLFPPAFADTLAATLAAAIAMPIRADVSVKREAQEDAANLLNQAMVMDFNSRPATAQTSTPASLRVRGYR